ncbi:50S ribosomal protein L33 [Metamycoplasma cloacale]|uniref:Large ribosomal subunit protein bL33 n=1 Tax=Metamycoplasma cloacale TaxID=92401 RepID=A0A2Z4LML9_9BACT|nr:50S ribosomal protein L33 [Metamycoplasma cloacale]AWX42487.1 50S ribosomal protein L33 [Metamycoplasma cloacale]
MKNTKKIILACQNCLNKNYRVNKSNEERLILKKFCKFCNCETEHKEEK